MYDVQEKQPRPGLRMREICCLLFFGVFILAIGVAGGICIGVYLYHGGPDGVECVWKDGQGTAGGMGGKTTPTSDGAKTTKQPVTTNAPPKCKTCPRKNPILPQIEPELFTPLTSSETQQIREFMIKEGLISDHLGENITMKSNVITGMDTSDPVKVKALGYLDKREEFPGRFARVSVNRGARNPPDCMIYLIGPLGGGGSMEAKQLYADGDIAFEARPISAWDIKAYATLLKPIGKILEPLTKDSFDGAIFDDGALDIRWFPFNGAPGEFEKGREVRVNGFFDPFHDYLDYNILDMLPLSAVIHSPGNNVSTYYVHSFYYLNQGPYNTAEDLLDAYNNGTLRKVKLPKGYRNTVLQRMSVRQDKNLPMRAHAQMSPPRTYESMGPRYTVKGHQVKWMGWQVDVTARMMRGTALFDIRYKGERIAYELSLNDVSLIYSSDSFERSNVVYTDSTYGIGYYSGAMKGVDCPEHATYLETRFYDHYTGKTVTAKSICVFEADGEEAAWRHKYATYAGGLRNNYLVIRASAVISNYDYITEHQFHLDGKLFTKVKATGFIQTAFWDEDNPNRGDAEDRKYRDIFGFKVSDYAHGIIHDHMFSFKVDLDIIDSNNTFQVIRIKSGDAAEAFKSQKPSMTKKPDYFNFNVARYLEFEACEREEGFQLDMKNQKLYTVVNENYRNRWGVKRGYQIYPLGTVTQSMASNHPAMQALSFSKYTCAVTKRKESESFSTSIYDAFRFDNPREDLEKKLNNEPVRNTDLTTWVSVGFFHVPTSEDVPMTMSLETGFILKPFNFFDKTDVYDMPQYYTDMSGAKDMPPDFEPCGERKGD